MKKKLLFVIPSLEAGGGEKSLVTLLNTIDLQKYEVDVLLLKKEGLFLKLVPKFINEVGLFNKIYPICFRLLKKCFREFV